MGRKIRLGSVVQLTWKEQRRIGREGYCREKGRGKREMPYGYRDERWKLQGRGSRLESVIEKEQKLRQRR